MHHHLESYGAIAQLGERLFCKQDVVGSNPTGSTIKILAASAPAVERGDVAQLVERDVRNVEVAGSTPAISTSVL